MLLQRSTDHGSTWENYARVSPGLTQFLDINVTLGQEYTYRMSLPSQFSNAVSGTTGDVQLNVPGSPSVGTPTTTSLVVSWTDTNTNPNEGGTEIHRSTSQNGTYALVGTVGPNVTSYTDTGLTPNTTYWYKARAIP